MSKIEQYVKQTVTPSRQPFEVEEQLMVVAKMLGLSVAEAVRLAYPMFSHTGALESIALFYFGNGYAEVIRDNPVNSDELELPEGATSYVEVSYLLRNGLTCKSQRFDSIEQLQLAWAVCPQDLCHAEMFRDRLRVSLPLEIQHMEQR